MRGGNVSRYTIPEPLDREGFIDYGNVQKRLTLFVRKVAAMQRTVWYY